MELFSIRIQRTFQLVSTNPFPPDTTNIRGHFYMYKRYAYISILTKCHSYIFPKVLYIE